MTTLVGTSAYRGFLGTGTPDSTSYFRGDGSWQSAVTFTSLSVTGNTTLGDSSGDSVTINGASWSWSGTATKLQADFSNSTQANRTVFQSNSVNSSTFVGVMPNGTGSAAGFVGYNGTNADNASTMVFQATATDIRITSNRTGVASFLPLTFFNSAAEGFRLDSNRNLVVGTGQLADAATDGFLYIPGTTSGAPSGTPTSYTGRHPMVVDDTNNRLYINIGGTWRFVTLT